MANILGNISNHCAIFSIIILSLMIWHTEGYRALLKAGEDGKCIYRGDTLELGVQQGQSPCQRLTCNEDGTVLVEGCGKLWIENCNRGDRISREKPYPECCRLEYRCKRPDGSTYIMQTDSSQPTKTENST